MREGWIETTLDGIADVVMGQSPDGKSYNQEGHGLPFMQGSAEFGEHNPIPEMWCSDPKKIAEPGDLLLSVRAPVGDTNFADQRIAVGRGLSIIRANKESLTEFIRIVIQLNVTELIASSGSGMFASITGKNLKEFKVNLPPLPEQKRIVDLISSVDSYIEALQQQLVSVKQFRNALLHELLTAGGEDWKDMKLSEVTELITDGSHYSPKTTEHGIPYVTVRDIKDGFLDLDNAARIAEESYLELERNGCRPLLNDILFSKDGTVGKVALVLSSERFVVLSSLAIIRSNINLVLPKFLALTMTSSEFQRNAIGSKTGLAIKRIVLKHLRDLRIKIPTISEQQQIVEMVSEIDQVISTNIEALAKTANLRKGLLSDLLSGNHEIPASYDKVIGAA